MKLVYIGEVIGTHGIKGEIRIISSFQYKKEAFVVGRKLFLGKRKQEVILTGYRVHKNYDMITLEGIHDINEAIAFKGDSVYIDRNDLSISGYVHEDIIGLLVYDHEKYIGKVENITHNTVQEILIIQGDTCHHMIPLIPEFVKSIDIEQGKIMIEPIEGLLNED